MTYNYNYGSSSSTGLLAGFGIGFVIFYLLIAALLIVSLWKIFVKAGKPGWAAIVPIYNAWVLLEIGGEEGWKILLCFIPIVGSILVLIYTIKAYLEIARRFGKTTGFAIGMILLSVVFFPILAFSDAQYNAN